MDFKLKWSFHASSIPWLLRIVINHVPDRRSTRSVTNTDGGFLRCSIASGEIFSKFKMFVTLFSRSFSFEVLNIWVIYREFKNLKKFSSIIFSPNKMVLQGWKSVLHENYSSSELIFYSKKTLRMFRMAPNIFLFPNDLPNAFSSNISLRTKKLSFPPKSSERKINSRENEWSNKISFRDPRKTLPIECLGKYLVQPELFILRLGALIPDQFWKNSLL